MCIHIHIDFSSVNLDSNSFPRRPFVGRPYAPFGFGVGELVEIEPQEEPSKGLLDGPNKGVNNRE